jgi:anti-anti-sigma regulatory factor
MLRGNARGDAAGFLLEELLQSSANKNVLVDWERAERVDPCVLQVLLAFQKLLGNRGLSLRIARDNPAVREYLQQAGLSEDFPLSSAASEPSKQGSDV